MGLIPALTEGGSPSTLGQLAKATKVDPVLLRMFPKDVKGSPLIPDS